ncbi:DUF4832 domain-containing protein [Aquimarina addita]|uniref:DUF4832 domain-containing protein n=2 Tax=Aquimarina addita TaxID=870485 RepID=A0ABP6UV35_9FLAO
MAFVIAILAAMIVQGQDFVNVGLHGNVDRVQPMTGIVFWADNESDLSSLGNKVQLEYSYLIYSDVVSQKDVYDWSVVDNLLMNAAARGRQVLLRFRYTYPGVTTPSVPDYIRNLSDYTDQIKRVEGSKTYLPDWSHQELQDFTLKFFTKFAERYNTDPRLAFVQVGFGSYSEYHLYDGPLALGKTFPSKDYQTTFLKHVDSVFTELRWAISIDAADNEFSPIKGNSSLMNLGFGLFDDSFLHSKHSKNDQEYNRASWLTFGATRAATQVAGGEFSYYSNYDQKHMLDVPNGPHGTSFEELADLYDISYIIGNDQLKYQTAKRIEEAAINIGYRFKVTSFKSNGATTKVTIMNIGLAPIYYDAFPSVNGVRSTTSLKGLLAGQSKTFTINAGATDEQFAIECDRLVGGQIIQFDADLGSE